MALTPKKLIDLRDILGALHNEHPGVLGNRNIVGQGCIGHLDAVASASVYIDIIHANTIASNDSEFGRFLQILLTDQRHGPGYNTVADSQSFRIADGVVAFNQLIASVQKILLCSLSAVFRDINFCHFCVTSFLLSILR